MINGEVIEGQIVEETERAVTIRTLTHSLTIPRTRIQSIETGEPGGIQILQAREFLQRGDLGGARRMFQQASEAGASPEALDALGEEIHEAERQRELARFGETINEAKAHFQAGRDQIAMKMMSDLLNSLGEDSAIRDDIIGTLCDFHLLAASQYRDRVNYERATAELNKVIELDPDLADPYYYLGDIQRRSSATWNQALTNYETALRLGEESFDEAKKAQIHWEMAEIARQQRDWRMASRHYRDAYQHKPDINLRIVERLQQAFLAYSRDLEATAPDRALRLVDEALQIRKSPDLLERKGAILSLLDRHQESNQAYEEMLSLPPVRRDVYYRIAQNYLAMGSILQGREMLQREVELFPDNYDALCLLGEYALQRDDHASAEQFFLRARQQDPDKVRASLGLGRAYRHKGELDKARRAVQEVLSRLPENREANLEMGRIFLDEGDLNRAREFFTEVLRLIDEAPIVERDELKPLHADALIARGEISLLTAGPGTANTDFRRALEVLPDYDQAYFSIGKAFRRKFAASKNLDDLKTAEENMLKARDLAPENPQYALETGILYAQELVQADPENEPQYVEKAVEHWSAYIELGGANVSQVRNWIREISG